MSTEVALVIATVAISVIGIWLLTPFTRPTPTTRLFAAGSSLAVAVYGATAASINVQAQHVATLAIAMVAVMVGGIWRRYG